MERVREGVCGVRRRGKSKFVCVFQELASVDSGRAWHSACQTLCVCVCVWLEDRSVGLPTPLASVRNLPFSLLKAGETMEGGEFFLGGGGLKHKIKSDRSVMM